MLDISLLTQSHFVLFLSVFSGVAVMCAWRARHGRPYIGITLAAIFSVAVWYFLPDTLHRWGFLAAAVLVALVGTVDEAVRLSAKHQLMWQSVIVAVLVLSGWTIPYVSSPVGEGVLYLDWMSLGTVLVPGSLFAFAWLLLMMNAVNWLDGADGLAGAVTTVGFFALVAVAMLPSIYSGTTLGLALVGAASLLAFFIWNFPPAKVYLGTVGSWMVGLFIGLTAMEGGGKIATASLILALPMFDVVFVIIRRFAAGRPIWRGDTVSHMHHRLRKAGVSPRHIVIVALVVTAWLGFISLLVPTSAKLIMGVVGIAGIVVAALRLLPRKLMLKRYEETILTRW